MTKFLSLLAISILTFAACTTGPETYDSDQDPDQETNEEASLVPEESGEETDINLDNALMELEIVDGELE